MSTYKLMMNRETIIKDVILNRDLVMATDPSRSGVLRVVLNDARNTVPEEMPTPEDIEYCERIELGKDDEKGKILFFFNIPEGAPRVWHQDEKSKRMVKVGTKGEPEA